MTLIGRSTEAARLADWARTAGPLTVWGPPGIGKTALVRGVLAGWRMVDARELSALPPEDRVVWDGVRRDVAQRSLGTAPRRAVFVTSGPLHVRGERALEVGRLDTDSALTLLEQGLVNAGHRADLVELHAVAEFADGIPLVLTEAIRGFDLLGIDGLTSDRPPSWLPHNDPLPHFGSLFEALQRRWDELAAENRFALSALALLLGPIRVDAARAMLGEEAPFALRRLRDQGWLCVERPGTLRLLRPIRHFVLSETPPTEDLVGRWAEEVLDWARARTRPFRDQACRELSEYAPDLQEAVRLRPTDSRCSAALAVLSVVRPVPDLLPLLERALAEQPSDTTLLLARARVSRAAGRFDLARSTFDSLGPRVNDEQMGRIECDLGSMAQAEGALDVARGHFQAALACATRAGDDEGRTLVQAYVASLDYREGAIATAVEGYGRVVKGCRRLGNHYLEGLVRGNFAVTLRHSGRTDLAREQLARALALMEAQGETYRVAQMRYRLGFFAFLDGIVAEADQHVLRGLSKLEIGRNWRLRLCFLALRGAITAVLGDVEAAHVAFRQAAGVTERGAGPRLLALVQLYRGFLDLAEGRPADGLARLQHARAHANDQPTLGSTDDGLTALAAALEKRLVAAPGPALYVGHAGDWFRLSDGPPVSFSRWPAVCRLLKSLADARVSEPGSALSVDALFAAGWLDDDAPEEARRNRVQVALSKLRSSGLKGALLRVEGGYLLDTELPVLLVGDASHSGEHGPVENGAPASED